MYDVATEQRRNGILLMINLALLLGVLGLLAFRHRGIVEWALLVSSILNLKTTLASRRALSHLSAALQDERAR